MVAAVQQQPIVDKYFGRKALILLSQLTLQQLFPLPPSDPSSKKPPMSLDLFLSYVLYRTSLPVPIVLHALYLLQRLSIHYSLPPNSPPPDPLTHHRLIFTALVISVKYNMDSPYSQKSMAVASRNIFTVKEISDMEIEMLMSLDHVVGENGLMGKLVEYEREFDSWKVQVEAEDKKKEFKLKAQRETFSCRNNSSLEGMSF